MSACRRLGQLRRPGRDRRIEGWGSGDIAVVVRSISDWQYQMYFDLRALIGQLN
jgi:hypothetical protein